MMIQQKVGSIIAQEFLSREWRFKDTKDEYLKLAKNMGVIKIRLIIVRHVLWNLDILVKHKHALYTVHLLLEDEGSIPYIESKNGPWEVGYYNHLSYLEMEKNSKAQKKAGVGFETFKELIVDVILDYFNYK